MKGDTVYRKALNLAQQKKPGLKEVFELLTKACDMGNHKAMYALATWYLFGKYVKKDYQKGFSLLQMASEGELPEAFADMAVSYETGKGVKVDKKKAFHCYLKAALLGDKQSVYEVGRCYYYGIGILKNKEVAKIWLEVAEGHSKM